MAVYKKTYRGYDGPLTPEWSRFLVLPRFLFEEMQRSRFLSLFFVGTFIFPLLSAVFIYLHHNLSALAMLELNPSKLLPIDERFFLFFLGMQSMLAFLLAAVIGPGLVSPDLSNRALPLYLARPFSRAEYVLGKMSVLVILLSSMTWVPGLMLFSLQSGLAAGGWMTANLRIASGLFVGSLVWIVVLALLVLALSAWVKWKPIAGGMLFGAFFVGAGFGALINEVLRTPWGNLINISYLIGKVWIWLFETPGRRLPGAVFFPGDRRGAISIEWVVAALVVLCAVCLWLLHKRIRGAEVVR
ncbi:MAG: hypothetical protein ACRD96_17705 [Bryobacteraceae bacterium]